MQNGRFNKYDYGDKEKNIAHYGSEEPPEIDLTAIQEVPIAMFVGSDDLLGDSEDNHHLKDLVKTVVHYEELEHFDHSGFLPGMNMTYVEKITDLM